MQIMLQILTGTLLVISTLGYILFVSRILLLRMEFAPLVAISSIGYIVFLGGLAGQLLTLSFVVLIVGLLFFSIFVFMWIQKKVKLHFSISMFHISFLLGSLFFLLLLFQTKLTHYDNFSHWAIVLKVMLSTDAFPTAASDIIDFKNYPLGVSSFIYYVCLFAGHSQSMMLVAQGLLIFTCFYAMFGIISEKRRFLLYAFLGLGLSILSYFNLTIRITNLLVDFLLPIFTLAIFAIIYCYRDNIKTACVAVLPLAGLLTVMKSTGIIFVAIGLIFLIYTWIKHWSKPVWKDILFIVGLIIGTLLPYFGWNWRVATVFRGLDNKFDLSATNLDMMKAGKTPEQIQDIISLFFSYSTDLMTRPAMGIVIFQLIAIAASIVAFVVFKKKWNLWKALIALDIVLLMYYAGILAMYLFSMPLEEAIWLAGFERYASSIVVLFVGGLVLCAVVDLERSFHYKIGEVPDYRAFKSVQMKGYYQKGTMICTAIAVTLLLSEYNGMQSIIKSYDTMLPYKVQAVTGDRWYNKGEEDKSRYLFYGSDANEQVTNYYMQYVGKYYLYAQNVDGIVLFYEDNMDNLLSGYDYLVVVESDYDGKRLLKKHYDVDMQEGIYKITHAGDQIVLTLQ